MTIADESKRKQKKILELPRNFGSQLVGIINYIKWTSIVDKYKYLIVVDL